MKKLTSTSKQLMLVMLVLNVLAFAIGVFFTGNILFFLIGITVSYLFSCFKVYLIEKTTVKSLDMSEENASNYVRLHYFLRYALTAGLLTGAALIYFIDLVGAIIPLFMLQPAAYIVPRVFKSEKNPE